MPASCFEYGEAHVRIGFGRENCIESLKVAHAASAKSNRQGAYIRKSVGRVDEYVLCSLVSEIGFLRLAYLLVRSLPSFCFVHRQNSPVSPSFVDYVSPT